LLFFSYAHGFESKPTYFPSTSSARKALGLCHHWDKERNAIVKIRIVIGSFLGWIRKPEDLLLLLGENSDYLLALPGSEGNPRLYSVVAKMR
jgi:hypothetical protein